MIRRASLSSDAIDEIEGFLCAEREWNMANECLSSETAVIDRLLASRDSLRGVYAKLTEVPASVRERRLRRLITIAAIWRPDRVRDQREALRRVKDFDADIQRKAAELAQMISKRNEVADRAGLVVGPAPDLHLTELVDPVPGDHISAAAMRSRKASVADTIRALLADREPITKGLTDADIADLVNVALALSADDLVTADRIKACRHR